MYLKILYGGIAQLGEHLLCKQGVIGSIPIISTIENRYKYSTKVEHLYLVSRETGENLHLEN